MPRTIAFINPSLTTRNVGDLFIADSVKRILRYDAAKSVEIDPRRPITKQHLDQINSCDAAVIVGTNLWYYDMPKPGRWMFSRADLERIRVPIVPLGIGTTRHIGDDNSFERETLEILKAIHTRCRVSSARDPRTLECLQENGITNVRMTGCPTMFRSLAPAWSLRQRAGKSVVVTARKGHTANVRNLVKLLRKRGFEPTIAAQQETDLATPGWWWSASRCPVLYRYDLDAYLDLMERSIGVIGWRLHGNMLHLAHGNPAVFFANCSRAQSFCQAFGLDCLAAPDHETISMEALGTQIDRLTEPLAFAKVPTFYAQHRAAMIQFLEANSLEHNLEAAPAQGAQAA